MANMQPETARQERDKLIKQYNELEIQTAKPLDSQCSLLIGHNRISVQRVFGRTNERIDEFSWNEAFSVILTTAKNIAGENIQYAVISRREGVFVLDSTKPAEGKKPLKVSSSFLFIRAEPTSSPEGNQPEISIKATIVHEDKATTLSFSSIKEAFNYATR